MKNFFDVILSILAMFGGAVAFYIGLLQYQSGQRWQQAAKGRELVDDLLKSSDSDSEYYAWDALKMLDYQDATKPFQTKQIDGQKFEVDREVIRAALTPSKLNEADDQLLYVRECFDELYFKLAQLQDAIDNGLVELSHVSCPIDYYAPLLAEEVEMHYTYMKTNSYERTLRFLDHFAAWSDAVMNKKLRVHA